MDISKFANQKNDAQNLACSEYPIAEVIDRIEHLNSGLNLFWGKSGGWAPDGAAQLLGKSRLDWQVSLSKSLRHWITDSPDSINDGDLILAWANLGCLIEGTIKLFLSVFYEDYKNDIETLKHTQAWHMKKEVLHDPDGLRLNVLIEYCEKAQLFDLGEIALFKLVQTRRNAIHAFQDRPIGTGLELDQALRHYLEMLRSTNSRLPYPDISYSPSET